MKKILIVQTAFIGDAILASSVVESLHALDASASLSLLVRKGNEPLYEDHPLLDHVLVWDKRKGKYKALWRLIRQVRKERYDAVVNLHRFITSGLLTAFSGAKERIGFDKNPLSFLFDRVVKHQIGEPPTGLLYKHEIDRNHQLIDHWVDFPPKRPKLYPLEADEKAVEEWLQAPYVCMAPASVWPTKAWPTEQWCDLIDQTPHTVRVYLIGGPQDHQLCRAIQDSAGHPNVKNLCGKTGLLAVAALMRSAKMNYVNDSAPLHLASAVNAPVTAIFCSTVPSFGFGPLSDQAVIAETHHQLDCRPCGLHGKKQCPRGHFKCAEVKVSPLSVNHPAK